MKKHMRELYIHYLSKAAFELKSTMKRPKIGLFHCKLVHGLVSITGTQAINCYLVVVFRSFSLLHIGAKACKD